jgi:hypothetical protein
VQLSLTVALFNGALHVLRGEIYRRCLIISSDQAGDLPNVCVTLYRNLHARRSGKNCKKKLLMEEVIRAYRSESVLRYQMQNFKELGKTSIFLHQHEKSKGENAETSHKLRTYFPSMNLRMKDSARAVIVLATPDDV